MKYELLGAFVGPKDVLALVTKAGRSVLMEQGAGPRERGNGVGLYYRTPEDIFTDPERMDLTDEAQEGDEP